ncbi:hypothetical protein HUA74_02330 [Myxococcus sp. CA051A]|uniref:Type II secretion system protein GspG C-terminal domain-containing protein n=1 Tax=Myxococcus llanfairpwllgwyngyllgogerychwyrndrobwllllantysiliogogogochensis TaxID=2590453 RepID=A0A540WQQ2_9BACT|nr:MULTISPECIES: hypothetical protein [Myxococcus]NTX12383.1 hypothetical protein [Myxococcus sp. CA056]NTX55253.1 hypothetical protein [Myxococcus sp. CA039A]NTX59490.1 hypothetical protein [Myxococcus sp. CA051A]TQF11341.1 hypothetical protein FJV41_34810 [Myxococcus llanfairpwllgwyngyllgogerychwyrndrobwllllantysiliogogogochensis]
MARYLGRTLRQFRDSASRLVQNAAALAVTVFVVLRPDRAGSERAQRNAERLITACRAFQARHGQLPQTLAELVPEFLPELPPAKHGGPHFGFTYDVSNGRHVLGWTDRIPFGRPFYVFEEDRWGYLD